MSRIRLSAIPLAATIAIAAVASPAEALVAYDARTLGMGGSSVGYATNGSLVYWNPAAVANSKNFGLFLPSLGVTVSNNILSVQEAMTLGSALPTMLSGGQNSASGSIFAKLGSPEGMNIQVQGMVEPLGFAIGRVGPGALALRVYGGALTSGQVRLSSDFATDLNKLIFAGGMTQITTAASSISAGASQGGSGNIDKLKSDVSTLRKAINDNMGSFIIGANGKTQPTRKEFSADLTTGVSGGVGLTYAQNVPLPAALTRLYPDAQLSLGATAKVLTTLPTIPGTTQNLPGLTNGGTASYNMLNGSAAISLDMDREVTGLLNAVVRYDDDPTLANLGELLGATQDFMGNGLTKTSIKFSSVTPDQVGVGADIGAHFKFDKWWSLGLTLVNPLLFWNAKKTSYAYVFRTNDAQSPIQLQQVGGVETVAFRAAEPFAIRFGGAFTPQLEGKGPGILVNDILVTAGLDAPLITGTNLPVRPSLHLGVEKLFGPLALRVGTQQLGFSSFYTGGFGIQTRWVQLNVGGGVDNPANIRGAAASATLGVLF